MTDLQTDDEKVEAIKKWWRENGVAVISGVVLGLVVIFGWRAWGDHRERATQRASLAFEHLLIQVATTNDPAAIEQPAAELLARHGGSAYATLARLALAKARNEGGDLAGASEALRASLERAPDPSLGRLAALRLARALVTRQELAEAKQLIEQHDGGAFAGEFAALRGDIAVLEQRIEDARAAYRAALAAGAQLPWLVELKLHNLPAAPVGAGS